MPAVLFFSYPPAHLPAPANPAKTVGFTPPNANHQQSKRDKHYTVSYVSFEIRSVKAVPITLAMKQNISTFRKTRSMSTQFIKVTQGNQGKEWKILPVKVVRTVRISNREKHDMIGLNTGI